MLHSRTKLVYNFLFLAPGRARRGNMNIHRTIRTLLIIGMATGLAPLFAGADDAALGLGAVRETTMAPQTRRLVQMTIDAQDSPDQLLDMLLAKKRAGDRREWLETKGNLAHV